MHHTRLLILLLKLKKKINSVVYLKTEVVVYSHEYESSASKLGWLIVTHNVSAVVARVMRQAVGTTILLLPRAAGRHVIPR